MGKRMFVPGLSVVCVFAMFSSVAATTMAQQVPVREVQGSDGTLYVVQGSNSWTLVPDQISDSDLAALNPSGEIDGTFPNQLFVVQAPAAPPVAAPAPAASAGIRVDVNKDLNLTSTGSCLGADASASKLIVSLASVDRQADGRSVWHASLVNHASVPIHVMQTNSYWDSSSAAYLLASDGTKYDAFAIADPTIVAVQERKALDVIPQQNTMPAGAYRLFFVAQRMTFGESVFNQWCDNWLWSSAPVSLP